MNLALQAIKSLRTNGPIGFARSSYNFMNRRFRNWYIDSNVRHNLPKTGELFRYNGFSVPREKRLGDNLLIGDDPNHEGSYVDYIRKHVNKGNKIVVIGGFYGVSTAAAAKQVGETGQVITFEATKEGCENVRRTVELNGLEGRVNVVQAVVGPLGCAKGNTPTGADKLPPSELPDCDVLAIDCDGCELELLKGLEKNPNKIILEHHSVIPQTNGFKFEYQENNIKNILQKKGYEIVDEITFSYRNRGRPDCKGYFVANKIRGEFD